MNICIESISPQVAKLYLEKNTSNRPIRKQAVSGYAREMAMGRWGATHQGIAFNCNGELIDGQHRLLAIVKSGVTIQLPVARGLIHDTQDVIDAGRKRTVADQLHLRHGLSHANLKAGVARCILGYVCPFSWGSRSTSMSEVLIILGAYGDYVNLLVDMNHGFKPGFRSGVIAAMAFACIPEKDKTLDFARKLNSGENIQRGDAPFALRNHLINHKIPGGNNGSMESSQWVFNALYNHVHGNPLLKIKRGAMGLNYFYQKQRDLITSLNQQLGIQ